MSEEAIKRIPRPILGPEVTKIRVLKKSYIGNITKVEIDDKEIIIHYEGDDFLVDIETEEIMKPVYEVKGYRYAVKWASDVDGEWVFFKAFEVFDEAVECAEHLASRHDLVRIFDREK